MGCGRQAFVDGDGKRKYVRHGSKHEHECDNVQERSDDGDVVAGHNDATGIGGDVQPMAPSDGENALADGGTIHDHTDLDVGEGQSDSRPESPE